MLAVDEGGVLGAEDDDDDDDDIDDDDDEADWAAWVAPEEPAPPAAAAAARFLLLYSSRIMYMTRRVILPTVNSAGAALLSSLPTKRTA